MDVKSRIIEAIGRFEESLGRERSTLSDDTDLIKDLEMTSDEGVDFACELEAVLGVEIPRDFNPFVHDSNTRGRKLRELIDRVGRMHTTTGGGV